MLKHAFALLAVILSGCATTQSVISKSDFLHELALNEAAAEQVRATGFYLSKGETLSDTTVDQELHESIGDWHKLHKQQDIYAILESHEGTWVLKALSETTPAYAVDSDHYKVISLASGLEIKLSEPYLVLK